MPETTERRAPIRVLVRGVTFTSVGDRLVGTQAVALLGLAKAEDWGPGWQAGDVEAMVWVAVTDVNQTMADLRMTPHVVDVRLSMKDVT